MVRQGLGAEARKGAQATGWAQGRQCKVAEEGWTSTGSKSNAEEWQTGGEERDEGEEVK